MSAWLSNLLVKLFKFAWPYIYKEVQEAISDYIEKQKLEKARAKATEDAKQKFDVIFNDPAKSAGEKADALKDLINS